MFDRLIDVLLQFIDLFFIMRVVDQWEAGVVLRFGRYHRTVRPGPHWVFPLGIERLITEDVNWHTNQLAGQALTTSDGVSVVLAPVVTWRVRNVKKVLLECEGHEQVMLDSITGVLAEYVTGVTWADLTSEEFRTTIESAVKAAARRWGIQVKRLQLKDVARARSLRLFTGDTPRHHL